MIIDEKDTEDPQACDEFSDTAFPEEYLTSGKEPLHSIYTYQETINARIINEIMKESFNHGRKL
jgi:hypothetical protein